MSVPDPSPRASRPSPDLILIFSDQQHFGTVRSRDRQFATPAWDALSNESVVFANTYCTTPLCSPSRASLMTGRFPTGHGVRDNGQPLAEESIGAALQRAGYRTAYFGKWHLGEDPKAICGWDEKQGVYNEYKAPNRPLSDAETTGFALEFLDRTKSLGRPFALFVSLDTPHDIYWAMQPGSYSPKHMAMPAIRDETRLPKTWRTGDFPPGPPWEKYQNPAATAYWKEVLADPGEARRYREIYRACVKAFDDNLARILERAKAAGVYDTSLIVVTSDHGDMDTHHGLIFKGPVPYEQLQRVPLAVKLPGTQPGQGREDSASLVSLADLWPTLLDYAGAAAEPRYGLSLRPALEGSAHARENVVVCYPDPEIWTVREGSWKWTRFEDGTEWLFDLSADPDETRNLASLPEQAGRIAALRRRLPPEAFARTLSAVP